MVIERLVVSGYWLSKGLMGLMGLVGLMGFERLVVSGY